MFPSENQENLENQKNQENQENLENLENQENHENQENQENQENLESQENQENIVVGSVGTFLQLWADTDVFKTAPTFAITSSTLSLFDFMVKNCSKLYLNFIEQ